MICNPTSPLMGPLRDPIPWIDMNNNHDPRQLHCAQNPLNHLTDVLEALQPLSLSSNSSLYNPHLRGLRDIHLTCLDHE